MENATKALLIAGGVLIFVALMSVMMYIFRAMGADTSELYSQMEESDITAFNQQFLNYDGKKDLTIEDVVTIINIAKDNNGSRKNAFKCSYFYNMEKYSNRDK